MELELFWGLLTPSIEIITYIEIAVFLALFILLRRYANDKSNAEENKKLRANINHWVLEKHKLETQLRELEERCQLFEFELENANQRIKYSHGHINELEMLCKTNINSR